MRKSFKGRVTNFFPSITALLFLALVSAGLVYYAPKNKNLAPSTAHASGTALTGYAWSGNIGWVSFSGTAANSAAYGVSVNTDGTLTGYAWGDNIGWINFGSNTCGATPTLSGGTLTGWAQAISTGSDGCISLNGTAANSATYGVTLSGTTFTGYAWGSDTIGWLSFSGTAANSNPYAVVYGGSAAPTCTLSASPNPAATNSSITLNYTTTNSPTSGTVVNTTNSTNVYSGTLNSSGGVGATSPASAGSYTYTMTATSPSGSGTCQTTLTNATDVCQNIAGLQSSWSDPNGYMSGGNCNCNSGYTLSGTQCTLTSPSITNFSGPTRVRSGNHATLTYTISNPPASCSIAGSNGYSSGSFSPTSGVQGQVTTTAITSNTLFTLTCGSVSSSINVGITPVFQEQ